MDRAGVRLFMMRPDTLLKHAKDIFGIQITEQSVQGVQRVDEQLDPAWASLSMRAAVEAGDRAQVVRLARLAKGWTQSELGRRCAYSASVISRLERGDQPLTDIAQLRMLCDALAIPPWMLGLAAGPDPDDI